MTRFLGDKKHIKWGLKEEQLESKVILWCLSFPYMIIVFYCDYCVVGFSLTMTEPYGIEVQIFRIREY